MKSAMGILTAAAAAILAAACEKGKEAVPEEAPAPRRGTCAFDLYEDGFRVFWIESKDGERHRWNGGLLGI